MENYENNESPPRMSGKTLNSKFLHPAENHLNEIDFVPMSRNTVRIRNTKI